MFQSVCLCVHISDISSFILGAAPGYPACLWLLMGTQTRVAIWWTFSGWNVWVCICVHVREDPSWEDVHVSKNIWLTLSLNEKLSRRRPSGRSDPSPLVSRGRGCRRILSGIWPGSLEHATTCLGGKNGHLDSLSQLPLGMAGKDHGKWAGWPLGGVI